jgi:hypothetical protein
MGSPGPGGLIYAQAQRRGEAAITEIHAMTENEKATTEAEPTNAAHRGASPDAGATTDTNLSVAEEAARQAAPDKPPTSEREPRSVAEGLGLLGKFSRDTRQAAPRFFGTKSTPEGRKKHRPPLRFKTYLVKEPTTVDPPVTR